MSLTVHDFVHVPPAGAGVVPAGARVAPGADLRWVRAALVYFLVAVALGVGMAGAHDFRLKGLHVHLNLLGWVSMALTAFVYGRVPAAAAGLAARAHFWLYQAGLPVMMAGLGALLLGHAGAEPLVAAGSVIVLAGVAVFVGNVLWHARPGAADPSTLRA